MRHLQIKISLIDSHLPIWRRFQMNDDYRLDRFHQVIQVVMGWWNAHLHEFSIGGRKFGMLLNDGWDIPQMEDETRFSLKHFPFKEGDQIVYLYDFGDNWTHILEIESIREEKKIPLKCLEGTGRCPYEDCGGVGGYAHMIEAMTDPNHPEHMFYQEYNDAETLPDFTFFDPKVINKELKKFEKWHNKHPRKKSTPWHQI